MKDEHFTNPFHKTMSTYHCEFCGEDLKFRMIGGATVPLHPKGSVCEGKKFYRLEKPMLIPQRGRF